jgi:ribonuclease P protein component
MRAAGCSTDGNSVIADVGSSSFPRSARVRTPQQFKATFSQGRRIGAGLFRLHVRLLESTPAVGSAQQPDAAAEPPHKRSESALEDTPIARLGISVSKRVAAHAVERNRIKRIARDSFRKCRTQLPSGDYVLLAQREAADAPPAALRTALSSLWQRAIALKPAPKAPTMPARAPSASDPI